MEKKQYELRILPLFEHDLNEITDYITYRLHNPDAADHLIDAVKLVAIREFSESFQIAPRIDIHNLQIATVSSIVPKGFPAETISRMMRIEKTHHLGICWRMRDSAH